RTPCRICWRDRFGSITVRASVNHRCLEEPCYPRRRSAEDGPSSLLGHIPQSPALDRPSSLVGKAANKEGSDTACSNCRTVKYLAPGRNIVQREIKSRQHQRKFGGSTVASSRWGWRTGGPFGRYCDRQAHNGEVRHSLLNEQGLTCVLRLFQRSLGLARPPKPPGGILCRRARWSLPSRSSR